MFDDRNSHFGEVSTLFVTVFYDPRAKFLYLSKRDPCTTTEGWRYLSTVNAFACFLCTVTTLKCCFHRDNVLFYEFCIKI